VKLGRFQDTEDKKVMTALKAISQIVSNSGSSVGLSAELLKKSILMAVPLKKLLSIQVCLQ